MTTETEKPSGFSQFNLSPQLHKALAEAEFNTPTPIQQAAIPLALAGNDIIACAQTGTGKTAAFLLPLITHLENNPNDTSLVLGPTREIVQQISEAARQLTAHIPTLGVCSIIGGGRMDRQLQSLAKRPRLVVGTPGRLNDFLRRRKLNLSQCRVLIFDEADRMLDMGFAPQIDEIVRFVPAERQTLMFSATIAPAVEKISKSYLKNPKSISVGQRETVPALLKQKVIVTTMDKKETALTDELAACKGTTLIFAQTQRRVEKLGYKLREMGFEAETIHGGRTQGQRFRALKCFKDGDVNILVATDVASRGLDIGNITNVVNYDLPTNPEDFLHRVGRTARNGKDGEALTLVVQSDFSEFNRIKKYLGDCEMVGAFAKGSHASANAASSFRRGRPGGNQRGWGGRSPRPAQGGGGGGSRFGKPSGNRSESSSGGYRSFGNRSESAGGAPRSYGNRSESTGGAPRSFGNRNESSGGSRSFAERSDQPRGGSRPFGSRPESSGGGSRYASRPSDGNRAPGAGGAPRGRSGRMRPSGGPARPFRGPRPE